MHAQKISAYADERPIRSKHAMHTLCERSARPRNFMHAQKISAYADERPIRSKHAMHTLCERSARPRRGRRMLTERPQYADVGGHKMGQFHDKPSTCW